MREFHDIYFDGSGELSKKKAARLHELLDEGILLLSGIQQEPRPNNEDGFEGYEKQCKRAKKRLREIAADISCSLIGKPK